jgi:hypothetical protein
VRDRILTRKRILRLTITYVIVIGIVISISLLCENTEASVFNKTSAEGLEEIQSEIGHDNNLVQYALDKINKDRAKYNLPPVSLSKNEAAQIHAEDLFATRSQHPSHWTTDGMKPYMKYSEYNGTGYVEQNVAITGYENSAIQKCEDGAAICEKIEPYLQIDKFQWNMVNNDTSCCDDRHKTDILNGAHNDVSLGIAYDDYYFALVQNFENNYIKFNRPLIQDYKQIRLSGNISTDKYELDSIGVYYDNTPDELLYEQNKDKISYTLGKLVAQVIKPPPVFSQYNPPSNYTLIEASKWKQDGLLKKQQ